MNGNEGKMTPSLIRSHPSSLDPLPHLPKIHFAAIDKQIQLVDYTDDESESSSTAPPKQRSKCVWGLSGDPFSIGAMLNATGPLDETFTAIGDEQQQHNTTRPKRQAAIQAGHALTMLSAKR
ncbi:hypothetical protein niasHT_012706 [Heterodera trifolii]|uniref:Uncharacterized protein n=1 Tax=Heterodera trifolii TaxID=157864 RepID=A0ABD2L4Y3_9BILA